MGTDLSLMTKDNPLPSRPIYVNVCLACTRRRDICNNYLTPFVKILKNVPFAFVCRLGIYVLGRRYEILALYVDNQLIALCRSEFKNLISNKFLVPNTAFSEPQFDINIHRLHIYTFFDGENQAKIVFFPPFSG